MYRSKQEMIKNASICGILCDLALLGKRYSKVKFKQQRRRVEGYRYWVFVSARRAEGDRTGVEPEKR